MYLSFLFSFIFNRQPTHFVTFPLIPFTAGVVKKTTMQSKSRLHSKKITHQAASL